VKDPSAWAVSAIVIGVIITGLVIITWVKGSDEPAAGDDQIDLRRHLKKIAFGLSVGGVFLGLGIGYMADISFLQYKLGFIPVWVVPAAFLGWLFVVEWKGFGNHPVRTPIIGAVTAALIFIAAGHAVLDGVSHEVQHAQVTARTTGGQG
jgi:hypothetical protein